MNRICLVTFVVLTLWLSQSLKAAPPEPEITATFSIVAVDPDNHICGAAVASNTTERFGRIELLALLRE